MKAHVIIVVVGWLLGQVPIAKSDAPAEFRAAWVSRFEWVSRDPKECQANIRHIVETLAEANFNAAVFQIRGAAETLYPSELEPWSPLIGGKDPGLDPVALAIELAHARGIAFHAYINPMPLRAVRRQDAPADPSHLFYRHGPNTSDPWVCVDRDGRPARSEYYYLSAGVPAVHAYLREVIRDVVRRYDVDGIHLDRIRYPGPEYSHDPVSRRRFIGRGNPERQDWQDWQRGQLDKLVNDLAAEIRAEKPHVVVSCAAWGIYNRYHIDGYGGFSSGYHDYFQDTWKWCRLGAMDVLMPMIYWDLADPKPNYDELVADFARGVGADHLVGGQRVFSPDENVEQIRITRDADALGTVLWNYRSAQRRGLVARLREELYRERAPVPTVARLRDPKYGTILGTVLADDDTPLLDAWVSLAPTTNNEERGNVFAQTWTTSADGRFAFLNVPPGRVRIEVRYEGVPRVVTHELDVRVGDVADCEMVVDGAAAVRDQPFLALVQPQNGETTTRDVVHVLGRTLPDYSVTVGGEEVEVYATGGFARDNIPLQIGENRIEIEVKDARRSHTRVLAITRVEPEAETAAPVKPHFVQPAQDVALQPGQLLEIRVDGPSGREGGTVFIAEGLTAGLTETRDDNDRPIGSYVASIRIPDVAAQKPLCLRARWPKQSDEAAIECESKALLEIWDPTDVRVAETTAEKTGISHGLHSVRLGGPWLAWAPKGTRFEIIGRRGANVQVRLSSSVTGWVRERDIRWLDPGTAIPHNFATSCHVDGDDDHDTFSVGMNAPVVVAVRSDTRPDNRLYVDFFNSHHALTWMSHKSGAQVIGPVRAEQIEEGWLRLTIPINCRQIWGYWTEIEDGRFTLHVRRPPAIAAYPQSPLSGLTIALEAGHGGSSSGAVGPFGTKEKTVNLAVARALERELAARGARVVQVRHGDEALSLSERVDRANAAAVDLFVSLHANSAGRARGHLRVSGTSTYYHDTHCYLAAKLIYDQLLELGWGEFGVVGNFSYAPLRNTRMPSILVEQAFMSHPGDEARLLDPGYQKQQAIAIANGLEAFLDRARE